MPQNIDLKKNIRFEQTCPVPPSDLFALACLPSPLDAALANASVGDCARNEKLKLDSGGAYCGLLHLSCLRPSRPVSRALVQSKFVWCPDVTRAYRACCRTVSFGTGQGRGWARFPRPAPRIRSPGARRAAPAVPTRANHPPAGPSQGSAASTSTRPSDQRESPGRKQAGRQARNRHRNPTQLGLSPRTRTLRAQAVSFKTAISEEPTFLQAIFRTSPHPA
jgi:hypothetical protein